MHNVQDTNTPLISFIVTHYNLPKEMLRECLDSIMSLSLSAEEREIILVDDGSEQSPLDCIEDIIDDITYIRQKNNGLSCARNTGLEMAKGIYIQFVDGDDMLVRAPYEHCLDIVRYENDIDMVIFDFDTKASPQAVYKNSPIESGATYMHGNNLHATAWGYIFRRSILGALRFTSGILHEDEEFTPKLVLRAEKLISTDAKAYFYRKRDGSIISNTDIRHKLKRLDDMENIIYELNHLAEKIPYNERIALKRRVHQLTMDYIYNIMKLTRSQHQLEERLERLKKKNLFPLPANDYTNKYKVFRLLTRNRLTRNILLRLLPLKGE